ncbi:hypothetical protein [Rhodohalobacter sp.]|uniref:hypothetical protein n=1 Tax=Rhodohalobacter sp. TaxID=1974210 RepID=UPI002ACEF447|nr:hypothetical protein [Rhodohalobacter sp.]MDZ7756270.1 hypothetical protein [Rhodohalobacter sp.]
MFFGQSLFSIHAVAQDTEYEKWKQQQEAEFQEYQDKFDAEFVKMLEEAWEEVGIKIGSDFYKERKPVTIPKAPPKPTVENETPKDKTPLKERITIDIPDAAESGPVSIEAPPEATMYTDIKTRNASINYFHRKSPLPIPSQLREIYSPREFSAMKTDSKKIAEFWDKVSRIDHEPILDYANSVREDLKLNDWGYVLLINEFAHTIYEGYDRKLVNLYNWFLLSRSGYQVRIGYDQNNVYLLYAVEYNVFNTKYYTLDGQRYYVIDLDENQQTPSSIFTYSGSHQRQNKKLNFRIEKFPNLGDGTNTESRTLTFSFDDTEYSIPLSINKELMKYFEYYPLTELPVFFTASMSDSPKKSMYEKLAPIISEMSEEEAVNFLLRFVQTSFDYKTDQDQFNREKYMMPEETLFYPYSDCDDRSILFANLVQELVGLEVVGLRYSKHLATAVAFSDEVDGDSHYHSGTKYTVADPTYVNANAGMTMPQYKSERPEIIDLQN